jgi:hypothetical protein
MTCFLRARYPLFMNSFTPSLLYLKVQNNEACQSVKFTNFSSQVSTRTTGLSPVQHANFNLRFSALSDVEAACREDEERRAGRTIDWIGSRIGQQAASWLEDPASRDQEKWWDDIKSCVQGDRTPVRSEGWNHPMACMSTDPIHNIVVPAETFLSNPCYLDLGTKSTAGNHDSARSCPRSPIMGGYKHVSLYCYRSPESF